MIEICFHEDNSSVNKLLISYSECKNSGGNHNNKHSHVSRHESRCVLDNQLQCTGGKIASGTLGIFVVEFTLYGILV